MKTGKWKGGKGKKREESWKRGKGGEGGDVQVKLNYPNQKSSLRAQYLESRISQTNKRPPQRTIKTSLILDSDPWIAMQLFHLGAQLWVHSVRVNGLRWESTCGQTHHALWQPQVKVNLVNVWSSLGVKSVLLPWYRIWLLKLVSCARLNVEEKKMRAPRDGNTYQDRRQDDRGNRGSQDNLRGAGHPGGRGLSWTWFAGFLTPTLLGGGGDRGRGDRGGRGGGRWAISGSTSPTWYLHQMI